MERYRIHSDGTVYFVTFSVVKWLPVFVSAEACKIVTNSFNFCHANKGLRVNAYVVMPTHLHAIVFDAGFRPSQLERTLWDLRKFTGRQLSEFCAAHLPRCYLDVLRAAAGSDRARRFWQPTRHPEQVDAEWFWRQKFDYLHENPCRKGLVRRAVDWRFSSAAVWYSEQEASNDVILSSLEW